MSSTCMLHGKINNYTLYLKRYNCRIWIMALLKEVRCLLLFVLMCITAYTLFFKRIYSMLLFFATQETSIYSATQLRIKPSNPAANPIHNSASVHRNVPEPPVPHNPPSVPLSTRTGQAELDTITPNQSLNLNASSANPDNKTPQASCLSDKTPSSASFSSAPRSARMGRLSNIRTPKGLTAPSPTINTREAMGVITAMLDSSLENNLFGWDGPNPAKVSSHDKDFEMDFANTGPSGENNKPFNPGKFKDYDVVAQWIRPRTLNLWGPRFESAGSGCIYGPLDNALYPHCLVPRKGLKAIGPLVACVQAACFLSG